MNGGPAASHLRNIMREDVSLVKSLWDHEVERIRLTEAYLVKRWGAVDALQMEDRKGQKVGGCEIHGGSNRNFMGNGIYPV